METFLMDGGVYWYMNGLLHRANNLPAVEYANGDKEWWFDGKLHRENDLPAVEYHNGKKEWWFNGELHRENDLPAVLWENGDKLFFNHSKLHRNYDKPAVEYLISVYNAWWLNGVNITSFRYKYMEARKRRAQKKIYFWIIKILYRPGSESAKRLSENSWKNVCDLKNDN